MTKDYCDICQKEMKYEQEVHIRTYGVLTELCISCFRKKQNWSKIIKSHLLKSHK